jgi:hypothetical protein
MEFQSTSTDSVVEPCAIETLAELDRLGDLIAELAVHLSAATARLLDLIREFDTRGGWNHGFRSCAAWLTWRVGFSATTAREHVRVARALGSLPLLAEALARGELSYSKVRELTRVAQPETEAQLMAVGRAGTAEHVERLVRAWRWMDGKAEAREAAKQHVSRSLQVYPDADGTVRIRGRLAPEVGALLLKALAAARETLYQRRPDEATDPPTLSSSRPTPWPRWPRPHCTTSSIPELPASVTRSWSTSTPRCWRTPRRRGSRCCEDGGAFQLERPSGWRATRAGW